MSRLVNVVRMQLINRQTYIWVPLLVLGGALVLSILVWVMLVTNGVAGEFYGGGSQAPLWYFAVVGVQALTLTFPFSQAMGVTRREFFLGTLLTAGMSGAFLALIFVVGGLAEQATNGWGINGYFFYFDAIWERGPLAAGFAYFVVAMLFFTSGFWGATVYKRFGSVVLTIVLIGLGLLLIGLMWLIGRLDGWNRVFAWFGDQGALGLSLWGLVLIGGLAALSFLTLRRAVP